MAALKAPGCEDIFERRHWVIDLIGSGYSIKSARSDVLVLGEAGAGFRSLTEAIATTIPVRRMTKQKWSALFAELERAMLKEPTRANLDAAREKVRLRRRRPKL